MYIKAKRGSLLTLYSTGSSADCWLNISQTIDRLQQQIVTVRCYHKDAVISYYPIRRETWNAAGGGFCCMVEIRPDPVVGSDIRPCCKSHTIVIIVFMLTL